MRIRVIRGDITAIEADVIVNAAGEAALPRSCYAKALEEAILVPFDAESYDIYRELFPD